MSAFRCVSGSDSGRRLVMTIKLNRTSVFVLTFWTLALGFIGLDWVRATPHNRFDEPPPWQLGQEKIEGAGHCAAPLAPVK